MARSCWTWWIPRGANYQGQGNSYSKNRSAIARWWFYLFSPWSWTSSHTLALGFPPNFWLVQDLTVYKSITYCVSLSPESELQPSPFIARPQVRRKIKQFCDESIILSNQYGSSIFPQSCFVFIYSIISFGLSWFRDIERGLDATSDIPRVRRKFPSSSLAIWK